MNFARFLCLAIVMLPSVAHATEDSLAAASELLMKHSYQEAKEELLMARAKFIGEQNALGEACVVMLLAAADAALKDPAAARVGFEDAAAKFLALDDTFTAWLSLRTLAELEKQEGQIDASIAVHERALAMLQKAAEPQSKFSFGAIKILGPVFGVQTAMLGTFADYPEMLKPILLKLAEVMTRDSYGCVLMEAGALEKAEEQFNQAVTAAAMFAGSFDAVIARHMGELRRRQWRLGEAREHYLKALGGNQMLRSLAMGDPRSELWILNQLAELELLTGRVDEALQWNDRALTVVRTLNDPAREDLVLEDRAGLLLKAGRFTDALALYEELLKRAVKRAHVSRQAAIHCDLGTLHMYRGTFGTSAKHLSRAIELYQQLREPYLEAPVWLLLAEVHIQLGMHDHARADLNKTRELASKSGFKLAGALADLLESMSGFMAGEVLPQDLDVAFQAWHQLAEARGLGAADGVMEAGHQWLRGGRQSITPDVAATVPGLPLLQAVPAVARGKALMDQGDFAGARTVWCQILETDPNNDFRAGLLGLIGASYWNEGNHEQGIRYFTDVAKALNVAADDIKVEEMLAGYFGNRRHWYYDILIDMLMLQGRAEEAFAQAERARARAFLQMVGNRRFNAERGADPRLMQEAEILRAEIARREHEVAASGRTNAVLVADLDRARQHYKTVLTQVKVSSPEYEALTNVESLPLETLREQLPADATLISYFVSARHVHAWVVDRKGMHYERLPIGHRDLQRIVCWARGFSTSSIRGVSVLDGCDEPGTAEDAFEQLMAPLLPAIQHQKLILVPHGMLHWVPFAALRNPKNGHDLLEDFALTYAPSASALQFLSAKETAVDGRALIVGDPKTSLSGLPGAAKEATVVARLLGTKPSLGAEAREGLLYDLDGKVDLIHLAAHGIYDPTNPLFSRIALAAGTKYDGNLTVDEILSSLDLTGVNLVVLSACQSAIGARSGGDEVIGLTRALLYAGTPGVVSTLWNIDDAASAELMKAFYERLVAGVSIAEALRQAQLAVKANPLYGDPRYWAAFVLTGDPQGRWRAE
ncbi:MAG TPA: CHAT domain-containing tetratricopeptide repeat protein [Thermoanaerobaculia bacterium]|nr:CHAT domain-containing tetratricopeptide repeat protein [Thermoanaerobaculia bacterium]